MKPCSRENSQQRHRKTGKAGAGPLGQRQALWGGGRHTPDTTEETRKLFVCFLLVTEKNFLILQMIWQPNTVMWQIVRKYWERRQNVWFRQAERSETKNKYGTEWECNLTGCKNSLFVICITAHVSVFHVFPFFCVNWLHHRLPDWRLHYNWVWAAGHTNGRLYIIFLGVRSHMPCGLEAGSWKGTLAQLWIRCSGRFKYASAITLVKK